MLPFQAGTGAATEASVVAVEDETGNPANWGVVAHAVCAGP